MTILHTTSAIQVLLLTGLGESHLDEFEQVETCVKPIHSLSGI